MKGDQWKKRFQELLGRDKPVKLVVLLGICGIVLIGLSSLWEPGQKTGSVPSSAAESQTYGRQLETDLARIVTAITGEEAPTVVVTLADNGRSLYASDERESGRQEETASTSERESSHILVEDADGNVILDNTQDEEQAIKNTTAYYINDMLTQVVSGTNGGGYEARISGMTVAGKTGTTDTRDNRWFVGYTPYYTAAVWVGYETPARVSTRYNNPAAHMWQLVMDPIHDGLENTGFTQPSGLTQVSYCLDCGGEATTACQSDPRGNRVATAYVFAEDRPSTVCTCHSLEEGSNSMVRVCVDDPVLDANGEFTGYYHLAGPNCPEVSIRTYSYLNLERESVGGAVAEDSQYFYSAYVAAAGTEQCTVHGEGGQIIDPDDPNGVEDPNGDPGGSGDEPGTGDSGGDSSGSSSQPGTDDPGTPGSSSSSTTDPMGNNSEGGVAINPETGRPYGY